MEYPCWLLFWFFLLLFPLSTCCHTFFSLPRLIYTRTKFTHPRKWIHETTKTHFYLMASELHPPSPSTTFSRFLYDEYFQLKFFLSRFYFKMKSFLIKVTWKVFIVFQMNDLKDVPYLNLKLITTETVVKHKTLSNKISFIPNSQARIQKSLMR